MANEFQIAIRGVLLVVKAAIMTAWEDTRDQVRDFDWRIRQTCFGQFLVGNVMRRVHELNYNSPSVYVDIKPNRRRSSYHVELAVPGFLCTISAVRSQGDLPRHAHFRDTIANSLQSYFTFTEEEGVFRFCPPSPVGDLLRSYLQILHGPKDGDDHREELGFINVAFLDRFRGEQWRVTTISKFSDTLSEMVPEAENGLIDTFRESPAPTEAIPDMLDQQFELRSLEYINPNEDGEGEASCQ